MSLFLRQACQSSLDGVGLSNYHVQVDETSKCLQVVGECGEVLVNITGIRLSRMAPADKEIELALSLFDDFLAKHVGTFKEFIAAKARADSAILPTEEGIDLLNISISSSRNYRGDNNYANVSVLRFDMEWNDEFHVEAKSDGTVRIHQGIIEKPVTVYDLQPCLSTREAEIVLKWIADCSEFNEAVESKEACLAILSSCEI